MNKLMNKLGELNWLKFPWFYHFLASIVLITSIFIINYTASFALASFLQLLFINGALLIISNKFCHTPKRAEFVRTNNVPKKVAIDMSFYSLSISAIILAIVNSVLAYIHKDSSVFDMPTIALVIYLIFVGLNLLMGMFSFLEYEFDFCIACKFANTINKLQNKRKK